MNMLPGPHAILPENGAWVRPVYVLQVVGCMQVNASVKEEGLGLKLWWDQPADDVDDMEEA